MNLRQIAEGWRSLYQPSDEIRQLAAARLAVCETCNEKRENNQLINGLIRGTVPEDRAIYAYSCGLCKCFLAAKAHAADSECPLNKWENIDRQASPFERPGKTIATGGSPGEGGAA